MIQADNDTSHLTCSPFSSPLQDVTNIIYDKNETSITKSLTKSGSKNKDDTIVIDDENIPSAEALKSKVLRNLIASDVNQKADIDDDVTIIDSKPEIIALSSDDEDDVSTYIY